MKGKNYSSCCFKISTQKFFVSAFGSCHCCLFIGFSCTFSSYFSISLKLHPDFSWLRRPAPVLTSTVTVSCCFLLPGLSFSVLLLLYRDCYGFQRTFFTLNFFLLTFLPQILCVQCFNLLLWKPSWESLFLQVYSASHVVWNTGLAHLFVWITQCSRNK